MDRHGKGYCIYRYSYSQYTGYTDTCGRTSILTVQVQVQYKYSTGTYWYLPVLVSPIIALHIGVLVLYVQYK